MSTFAEIGLKEEILKAVKELGFENPTPIQAKAIPILLDSNQDLIASAQTGTGKTAAFGLPVIQLTDTNDKRTQCLILCPTRELCLQIAKDLATFSKYCKGIHVVAVYGGAHISAQIKDLNRGAQIVVGTPGRTKDLIKRRKLILKDVKRVVLDEADEMLTMGFKEDLDAILAETPADKQTLLFSATMSKGIISITKKYMDNPTQISVAKMNKGADNVTHLHYTVQAKDKYELLKRIADINPNIYGIVFCRTRKDTNDIAHKLIQDGYNADVLNGDLSQAQRDAVMAKFRKGQLQILVATDVAARGLDVNDLTHVINYSLPDDPEIYVHRSGRTGRAGKSGISIAITHTRETRKIQDIERKGGIVFKKESAPTGKEICARQLLALIDKIEKVKVDEKQIEPFLPSIYEKLAWLSREELIKHFVSAEFNRFLEYYKHARDISATSKQKSERATRREDKKQGKRGIKYTRLFINSGSSNKLNPKNLLALINEGLRSASAEIGKIEILKAFSFFEIEVDHADQVIEALNGQKYEGQVLSVEVSQPKEGAGFSRKKKWSKDKNFAKKRKRGDSNFSGGRGKRRKKDY